MQTNEAPDTEPARDDDDDAIVIDGRWTKRERMMVKGWILSLVVGLGALFGDDLAKLLGGAFGNNNDEALQRIESELDEFRTEQNYRIDQLRNDIAAAGIPLSARD